LPVPPTSHLLGERRLLLQLRNRLPDGEGAARRLRVVVLDASNEVVLVVLNGACRRRLRELFEPRDAFGAASGKVLRRRGGLRRSGSFGLRRLVLRRLFEMVQ